MHVCKVYTVQLYMHFPHVLHVFFTLGGRHVSRIDSLLQGRGVLWVRPQAKAEVEVHTYTL